MPLRRAPMSPVDAAWYQIDGPANLAQVTSVLLTARPVRFGRVVEFFRNELLQFDRFRQRVVTPDLPLLLPYWEEDADFDIYRHICQVRSRPVNRDRLMKIIGELFGTPLDRLHPLWQIHVVNTADAGSALIIRFHHAVRTQDSVKCVPQARAEPGDPPHIRFNSQWP